MLRTNLVWPGTAGSRENFDPPPPFSEGLAATNDGAGKLAYMDKKGQLVIRTDFPAIPFSSVNFYFKVEGDLAPVCGEFLRGDNSESCSKWGYVNHAGKVVIPAELAFPLQFIEGLAVIERNGKFGYINNWGHLVIPAKFDWAIAFTEGVAGAVLGQKRILIDKAGEVLCELPPANESVLDVRFSEGLAPVSVEGKHGFMDKKCQVVIAAKFDGVGPFSEGLAAVGDGEKSGYIDKTGRMVIAPQFSDAYEFNKGVAMVYLGEEKRYIDKTGRFVTETGEPLAQPATKAAAVAAPPSAPTAATAAPPPGTTAFVPPPANDSVAWAAIHFQQGQNLWSRNTANSYIAAINSYREAVRLAPENGKYQHRLGFALHALASSAEGIPHLQKAVQLDPKNWEYLAHLADALTDVGRTKEALQAIDKALAMAPNNPYALGVRKKAQAKAGKPGKAR